MSVALCRVGEVGIARWSDLSFASDLTRIDRSLLAILSFSTVKIIQSSHRCYFLHVVDHLIHGQEQIYARLNTMFIPGRIFKSREPVQIH